MPPDVATDWVPGRSGSSGPLAHCDAGVVQGKVFFCAFDPLQAQVSSEGVVSLRFLPWSPGRGRQLREWSFCSACVY